MWNERYSAESYAYGKEANDFLRQSVNSLPRGRVLSLAEGEGRNAVFLAGQGYQVMAVDAAEAGRDKALRLARERGVTIDYIVADLQEFDFGVNRWDGVVSIFCHLPPQLRAQVHRAVVRSLKPGGVLLLEAYTPAQLVLATGGPPSLELMMDSDTLRNELADLRFERLQELERDVTEGLYHSGRGAVVQAIARK